MAMHMGTLVMVMVMVNVMMMMMVMMARMFLKHRTAHTLRNHQGLAINFPVRHQKGMEEIL